MFEALGATINDDEPDPAIHAGVESSYLLFDEVAGSTGTKDATDLAHDGNSVGNGAQRPGRQRRVDGVALKLQGLAVQTDEIDCHVTLG